VRAARAATAPEVNSEAPPTHRSELRVGNQAFAAARRYMICMGSTST